MYTALFVKNIDSLLKRFPPKHTKIFGHHSTIEFEPKNIDGLEIGKDITIKIIGRAWDEYGDDLLVENPKSINTYPHITLSRTDNAPPLYSQILFSKQTSENHMEYFESESVEVVEGYSLNNQVIV
ncbi:MAG: hypothetical protein KBB88_03380 [Candidatus Pacebacteria bacterium]|nr:hypothetical protein [Candidatus Paceibacterota bacterium]